MIVDINFGDMEEKVLGGWLPEGKYLCKTVNCEIKRSAQKGTPFLELTWEAVEGEHKGERAIERKYLTIRTAPYVKGWAKSVMNVALTSNKINPKVFVNRFAEVVIKSYKEMYNGEEKERKAVDSFPSEVGKQYNKPIDASHGADDTHVSQAPREETNSDSNANTHTPAPEPAPAPQYQEDDIPF